MQVERGESLTAEHVREMMLATSGAASFRVAGAHGRAGISGPSLALLPQDPLPNGVILAHCRDDVPLFGLVEFKGAVGQQWTPIPTCSIPFRYCGRRIGIALEPADSATPPAGPKIIRVQVSGISMVRYDWSDPDPLVAGETLGAREARSNANRFQKGNGGIMQVLAIGEHDPTWADYNYAVVRLNAERLDWQRVTDCYSGEIPAQGTYQVIVFGSEYTLTEPSDGVVLVTPAP